MRTCGIHCPLIVHPHDILNLFIHIPGDRSFASGCALTVGSSLIFGPNAICRYFSYKGTATVDSAAVEEWLEWEATALAQTEKAVAHVKKSGGVPPPQVLSPLQYLEDKLSGQWLVDGVR